MEQNPIVTIKKKNLYVIIDYCVEKKLEFIVRPRLAGDEFDIEVIITSIQQAILFGMFLRENRLMPNGMQAQVVSSTKAKATKSTAEKSNEASTILKNSDEEDIKEETINLFYETHNQNS